MGRRGFCNRGHPMIDPVVRMVNGKEHRQCRLCKNAGQREKRMNDVPKPPKRQPYTPDSKDPAVIRARKERERVLKQRARYGDEWYKRSAA